jgi:hypothetical protein
VINEIKLVNNKNNFIVEKKSTSVLDKFKNLIKCK